MATVSPQFIIEGLMRRGYPSHVAQGFVMNMMDESGLNPGINEISPLVPGSRGGFGLYQLTGPRRTAYETFALQRGVDPSDAEAQLDFLDFELRGPESRAAKSILSTQNPQEAAAAIARDFLRPAPENLQKRLARYSGADVAADTMQALGKGKTMTPMVPTAAPQQERKSFLGGLLSDPDLMDRLAIGFAGMTMNPNVGLQQLAASRIASRAEERKAEKETNKTVEMLQRMGADPKLIELAQAGYAKEAIGLAYAKPKTGRVVTAEQLQQMFPGAKIEPGLYNLKDDNTVTKVGGGGTSVTVGGSEKAWEKGIGEYGVKTYEAIQGAAANAQNILSRTAQLEALMQDPEFRSGALTDSVAAGKKIIEALGGSAANVGSIEGFKSIASQLVLDSMGGSLGAGFSEGDRKFVQSIQPSLDTSIQGNKLIIGMQRAIAERKLQIAEFADRYVQEFGRIDEKFNSALRKWSSENPLFTPSEGGPASYF